MTTRDGSELETSLEGAYAWLDRADEHLHELRTVFQSWLYAERELAMKTVRQADDGETEGGQVLATVNTAPNTAIPPRVGVLVGEVVQALRRALDYLVYELAARDSGSVQDGTQFPFEQKKSGFKKLSRPEPARPLLRGLGAGHVAALRPYQPYRGAGWAVQLQSISNPDKHRHLTVTDHRQEIRLKFTDESVERRVSKTTEGFVVSTPLEGQTAIQLHVSFRLTIDDDLSVFETLTEIRERVAEVLGAFEPCFSGSCPHGVPAKGQP